jgi:hypothetical protein
MSTINDDSIKLFLELTPKHRAIIAKMGADNPAEHTLDKVLESKNEFDKLFAASGTTLEDFAILTTKISMGLASIQLEQQALSAETLGLTELAEISDDELSVLRKYSDQIMEVLDIAGTEE